MLCSSSRTVWPSRKKGNAKTAIGDGIAKWVIWIGKLRGGIKEPRQKSWQHADSFQPCFDACGIARHVNPLIIGTSGSCNISWVKVFWKS